MRISDWSSDVCSSDLAEILQQSSLLGKLPPCCSQLIPHPSQASFESAAFYTEQIGGLSETAHFRAAVAHGAYVEKSNQHQRDGGGGNDPRHCGQPRPRTSCSEKTPSIRPEKRRVGTEWVDTC